jgi:hypothetical protein
MKRMFTAALCAVMAAGTAIAQDEKQPGQPPGGRGGRGGGQFGRGGFGMGFGGIGASYVQILEMKEVQDDLKLSADEKGNIPLLKEELTEGDKKFGESLQGVAREEMGAKMTARREEVEKQLKEVLGDKYTRFKQIRLQLNGLVAALTMDKEVQDALNFTEDQRNTLRESARGGFQGFQGGERPSPEKMREMMEERTKKMAEEAEKILTPDQKKKWEEMIGAKITYKRAPMQFGRGPGGPGGGRPEGAEGGRRRRRGGGDNPPPGGGTEKKPPMMVRV